MDASDYLIQSAEHLRLAKVALAEARLAAYAPTLEVWGAELNKLWLRVASIEEQVEELSYEL